MASKYYTPPPQVIDGDIAYAADVNDVSNEADAAFIQVETDINNATGDAAAWAAVAKSWAEGPGEPPVPTNPVEPGLYAARKYATDASASASAANTSASNASTSEGNAATSAANAATSETNAGNSAAAALASQNKASEWAAKAEAAAASIGAPEDIAFGISWNGSTNAATKNVLYAKFTSLTKSDVGLANVDNTADADKPISNPQAAGLVSQTGDRGAAEIPAGLLSERPGTPANGYFRFNTDDNTFEGYDETNGWGPIGGRGGGLAWQTAKTAGTTGVSGEGYPMDTSAGALTLTLPASPVSGDTVGYKDYGQTFNDNALTIARNGANIEGLAEDLIVSSRGAAGVLVYIDAAVGWLIVEHTHFDSDVPTSVTGAYVTGGIYGGNLVYNTTTTVDVEAFSMMDDTLELELKKGTTTTVDLGSPTANTIYNLFAVREAAGTVTVKGDTDIDGAGLTGITHKRWVGFVRTNASSQIASFIMREDEIWFLKGSESIVASGYTSTTHALVDFTPLIPAGRVSHVCPGGESTASNYQVVWSVDGVNTMQNITSSVNTISGDTGFGTWGYAIGAVNAFLPYKSGSMYAKVEGASHNLKLHAVRVRR